MKILAGLGLDARRPKDTRPMLGTLAVGIGGLMDALEFRAGLVPSQQPQAERVVRYRNALAAVDSPARFYHRSLHADPLATAETLLRWRDFARNNGWPGVPGAGSPGRLSDLAEVETALTELAPCLGERVNAILPRLDLIAAAIDEIGLLDARPYWPAAVQSLFDGLERVGIAFRDLAHGQAPGAPEGTDLGLLQRALIGAYKPSGHLKLAGDGSLSLYRCLDTHAGVNALCVTLAQQPDHLLIMSDDVFVLGAAARHRGFADPGLGEPSQWRPTHQLLPLLIQIAWSPPTAETLLQYLTLPTGPYRSLRGAIAKRFTDLPGHDQDAWGAEIDAFITGRLDADPSMSEARLRDDIDAWLPVGAAGSRDKIDRELAIRLVAQVRDYWRSRYGLFQATETSSAEAMQFLSASQAADAAAVALRTWDDATISREQIDRLLDMAAEASASTFARPRQVSALNAVVTPEVASLCARAPANLAWWAPELGADELVPPFDADERMALSALPDRRACEQRRQAGLMRAIKPLIAATESATLVVHDDSDDLLRLHLDGYVGPDAWRSLDADLIGGCLAGLSLPPVEDLALPPARRWWHIGQAIPCPRTHESYSSLSSLALSPHAYVLSYAARLSQGSIVEMSVNHRLKGNLGHRLIQAWFDEHPWTGSAATRGEIDSWLDARLDPLILDQALPLAAPGMRAERLAFRTVLAHALARLLNHLAAAHITTVRIEQHLEHALPELNLEGSVDLLAQRSDGRWVIVDIKWGGERDRIAELREGRALQLATYARLAEGVASEPVADVAYFILRSGTLLATSCRTFPAARVVEQNDPAVTPDLIWTRFMETIKWRGGQLGAGNIEISSSGLDSTVESVPPASCLPLLDIESAAARTSAVRGGRKPTFKPIDPWRILTGQIKES